MLQRNHQGEVAKVPVAIRERARVAMIARYKNMGRPFVRAELIFARHICALGQDRFRRLGRQAEQVLTDVATEIVDSTLEERNAGVNTRSDGTKLLQDALTALFKQSLSPEQWSMYLVELEKRRDSRKPVAIRYLVNVIDRELFLTDSQRAILTESLPSHWDDHWNIYLDYMLEGNSFYPAGLDALVSPVLSSAQRKLWQGSQRVSIAPSFGGPVGRFAQDADALEEERGEVAKVEPATTDIQARLPGAVGIAGLKNRAAAQANARLQNRRADSKPIPAGQAAITKETQESRQRP
jgi:hypothetical protein